MNIQEIIDQKFSSREEAIAKYGESRIWIAIVSPLPVRPLPCSFEEDLVIPCFQPIKTSKIQLVLSQLHEGQDDWWQYINIGEV